MESFVFALNAVLPIILTVALGYFLKVLKLIDLQLSAKLNKLVFRVFLPCMLFLNVSEISADTDIGAAYIIYSLLFVTLVFLLALLISKAVSKSGDVQASLAQSFFRSNFALIGIPLAESLFPKEGAAVAGLLSAFSIPLFNIYAVLCFSILAKKDGEKTRLRKTLISIAKNPLIISVLLGCIFAITKNLLLVREIDISIKTVPIIYKTLSSLSTVATPLALISLGAQFEFSQISQFRREIILGTAMRIAIVPTAGLFIAYAMKLFTGAHFAALLALFATPVAVSSVPMAQELGGNKNLSGQLVVWTTLLSAVTVFLFSFILKEVGIF